MRRCAAHLHDQVWPVRADTSNADACLRGAIGSSHACAPLAPAPAPACTGGSYIQRSSGGGSSVSPTAAQGAATHSKRDSALRAVSYEVTGPSRGGTLTMPKKGAKLGASSLEDMAPAFSGLAVVGWYVGTLMVDGGLRGYARC
jgi:hypothetical protein